jgi:hypothetical protein
MNCQTEAMLVSAQTALQQTFILNHTYYFNYTSENYYEKSYQH